jgi:hypothetical protein
MSRVYRLVSLEGPGLAFATAASLAELAPIALLLREGLGLESVLAAGLAYQAGGALARWVPGMRWLWIGVGAAAAALLTYPPGSLAWLVGLAALAWGLQAARRCHAGAFPGNAPTTAHKRAARVLGFLAAPLIPLWLSAAGVLAAIALSARLCSHSPGHVRPRVLLRPIELVMVLHQMHYFSYCYGLLLILASLPGGSGLVGLWFGIGWITYLSAERLWSRAPLAVALVCGHLVVALTLTGLATLGHVGWIAVLCWALTGFGGGTVFCLTHVHRAAGLPAESLDVAEDIGHVGGAALALFAAVVLGFDPWALAAVGAALAIATLIAFLAVRAAGEGNPLEA